MYFFQLVRGGEDVGLKRKHSGRDKFKNDNINFYNTGALIW